MIYFLLFLLPFIPQDPEKDFNQRGRRAAPRDAFPVFNNPRMVTPAVAEDRGFIRESDIVIGVAVGKEAK